MNLRKCFLWALLGSLGFAALLGVQSIVLDQHNERWMETMLAVALLCMTAFAATVVMDKGKWKRGMILAIGISATCIPFYLYVIWGSGAHDEWVGRSMGTLTTWAIALPILGFVALTEFDGFLSIVRRMVVALGFAFCAMFSATLLFEVDNDAWTKLLGVMAIFAILGVAGIGILYRVYGAEPKKVETSPLEVSLTCPRCLMVQTMGMGQSRCKGCRLKITLEIEEPRCPKCDYLLYRLTTPQCPECGTALGTDDVETTLTKLI